VLAVAAGLATRSAPPESHAGSGTRATTAASPTASARTATPSVAPSAPPLPAWPGQSGAEPPGLPARGPGADASGSEVTAALGADRQSVDVYERAVLTRGRTTLALRPAGSPELARSLDAPLPTVEGLQAAVDGRPVPVTRTAAGWNVTTPSGTTVARLVLRYRLTGALVRREPSPPGRYTLVLTPLAPSAGGRADDAVVVRIRDPRIEEVYCIGASQQLCGRVAGALHTAAVPAGAVPVVIALVTFPS
jgi:hypothetical protein